MAPAVLGVCTQRESDLRHRPIMTQSFQPRPLLPHWIEHQELQARWETLFLLASLNTSNNPAKKFH